VSDNTAFACLVFAIASVYICSTIGSTVCSIVEQKEITARQSKQAVESNFKLAYELWAEDRPRPVQAFTDWKKEHTMELSPGALVVKLKDDTNSGDAIGNVQK